MEILRQSLLDSGGGARYDYYTVIAAFDIDPGNTPEARDVFTVIKQVISQKAEIVDDIVMRTYTNDDSFDLKPSITNKGKKYEIYQYLFSVSSHNNGWQSTDELRQALGNASVPQKMLPTLDNVFSISRFHSIDGGMTLFFTEPGKALDSKPAQLRVSATAPVYTQGRNGDVILQIDEYQNVIRYHIKLSNEWKEITNNITFFTGDTPPGSNQFQMRIDGAKFARFNNGHWEEPELTEFKQLPNDVVNTQLFMFHTNIGTELYQLIDGVANRAKLTSKIVLNEYDFVRNIQTGVHNESFNVLINNNALIGADVSKLTSGTSPEEGGTVKIYRNSLSDANLVAETTNLIWKSKDTQALVDINTPNTAMIVDTPETFSSFNSDNGSTDNIFKNFIQYPDSDFGFISKPTVQGTPYFTPSDTYPIETKFYKESTRTYEFGKVSSLGVGTSLTVMIRNSDAAQSQTFVFDTIQDGTTTQGCATLVISGYSTDVYGRASGTLTLTINNNIASNIISAPLETAGLIDVKVTHNDGISDSTAVQERYFYNNPNNAVITSDNSIVTVSSDINTTVKHVSGVPILTKDAVIKYTVQNIKNSLKYVIPKNFIRSEFSNTPFTTVESNPWETKQNISYPSFSGVFDSDVNYEVLLPVGNLPTDTISTQSNWTTTINRGNASLIKQMSVGPVLVDKNIGNSTDLFENFSDETYRLNNARQPWQSMNPLTPLDAAQFMGKLGVIDEVFVVNINGVDTPMRDFTNSLLPGPDYSAINAVNAIYIRQFKWNDTRVRCEFTIEIDGSFGVHNTASEALAAGALIARIIPISSLSPTLTDDVDFMLSGDQYNAAEFLSLSTRSKDVRTTNIGNTVGVNFGSVGVKTGFTLSLGLTPGITLTSIRVK